MTLRITKMKLEIDNCLIKISGDAICMREADYRDGRKMDASVMRINGKPMIDRLRSIFEEFIISYLITVMFNDNTIISRSSKIPRKSFIKYENTYNI